MGGRWVTAKTGEKSTPIALENIEKTETYPDIVHAGQRADGLGDDEEGLQARNQGRLPVLQLWGRKSAVACSIVREGVGWSCNMHVRGRVFELPIQHLRPTSDQTCTYPEWRK